MNNRTGLALLVILLIFLYYRKKRSKIGYSCAELWDNMNNERAEEMFFNTMSMIDNDPDTIDAIKEMNPTENFEYAKCRYATNYLLTNSDTPVISASEKAKIDNCICERHK